MKFYYFFLFHFCPPVFTPKFKVFAHGFNHVNFGLHSAMSNIETKSIGYIQAAKFYKGKSMIGKNERDIDENLESDSQLPNDYPIPSEYPEIAPAPVKEPNSGPIPGQPKDAPVKEPNKKPRIRVLNLQP